MKLKQIFILSLFLLSSNQLLAQSRIGADSILREIRQQYPESADYLKELGIVITKQYGKNPQLILQLAERGIQWSRAKNDSLNEVTMLSHKGVGFFFLAQHDSSIFYFKRGLELGQQLNNLPKSRKAKFYNNLGLNYNAKNMPAEALDNFLKALEIKEEIQDPSRSGTYNNLGLVYEHVKDYNKAIAYFEKALKLKIELGQQDKLSNSLNNLSRAYNYLHQLDKAIYYQEEALKVGKAQKNKVQIANSLNSLAEVYLKTREYNKALTLLTESYDLRLQLGAKSTATKTAHHIIKAYLGLAEKAKAKEWLDRVSMSKPDSSLLRAHYDNWVQYYILDKNYDSTAHYSKLLEGVRNKEIELETVRAVRELEAQYKAKEKQQQIDFLEELNQLNKEKLNYANSQIWLVVGILILFSVLLLMLFFLYRYRLKTNKELEALNMTKDRLFATLAHDLKNPLSAFRSITQSLSENLFNLDKEEVLYFLSKLNKSSHQLNDLLQNLLHWAISQIDQLNIRNQPLVLKEMVESIIELLRLNAEERNISIEVSCPEQLIVYSDSEIIKTILRNLISNAIKFSKRSGQILVSAKENEDWIELAVRDHGIGIAEENIPLLFDTSTNQARIGNSENKGTGLGLFLCNDLGKRLGAKLEVESQLGKGSCFKLKIPKS